MTLTKVGSREYRAVVAAAAIGGHSSNHRLPPQLCYPEIVTAGGIITINKQITKVEQARGGLVVLLWAFQNKMTTLLQLTVLEIVTVCGT